jgi:hypothetical protein
MVLLLPTLILRTVAAALIIAQKRKYGLRSKNVSHTEPAKNAVKLPKLVMIEICVNNLLHWLFGTDSITSTCVTGLFPIMKNPVTDEIVKTKFKSSVKNKPTLQIVIDKKQVTNIVLFI